MWKRPWVVAIVLVVYAGFMMWLATFVAYFVFDPVEGFEEAIDLLFSPFDWGFDDPMWWVFCGLPALLIVGTQALFLWPLRSTTIPIRQDGKPLKRMIVTAGLVGAVLTMALMFGIAAAVQLIWSVTAQKDPSDINVDDPAVPFIFLVTGVLLLGSWFLWSIILRRFVQRHDPNTRFDRICGLLLAGTVIETLAVLPVDIMIRRRTDCYCGTGGFYSLCMSAFALLWLAGPGAALLLTKKRRRRAWAQTHCPHCGYVKGPTPAEKCPECGCAWALDAVGD